MMASRYGRQKKRKAALTIKNLEIGNALLRREKMRSQDLMSDCIRVLGPNFIGLPAKTIHSSICGDYLRVPQNSFEQSVGFMSGLDLADNLARIVREIGVMRSDVRHDKIMQAVHFRVRHPATGEISYCIDRETMREIPSDVLIRRLSIEIAEQFSVALSKNT